MKIVKNSLAYSPAKKARKSDGLSGLNFRKFARVLAPGAVVLSVFALAIVGDAPAHAEEHKPTPATLTMSGTGSVTAAPDIAIVTSSVVKQAKTAKAALMANNEAMQNVLDLLKTAGVEARDMQTSGFNIQPEYEHYRANKNGVQRPPRIVSYRVQNGLTVRVRKLDQLGDILTDAVLAGSNQLGGIRFDIDEKQALLDQARENAFNDAKRKAEIYLKAAGVDFGRVVAINENGGRPQPRMMAMAKRSMDMAEAAPVPVSAGETELSVRVNVTWEIKQ